MRKLIGVLALGAAGFAFAQVSQHPSFEEVDTNQDGQLSRSELAAIEGLEFSEIDTNQDGTVDRQEYMAATRDDEAGPGANDPGSRSPGGAGGDLREGQPAEGRSTGTCSAPSPFFSANAVA